MTTRESATSAFKQLGFDDSDVLGAKTEAVILIRAEIKKRGITQSRYAELVGLQQSNLSAFLNGDLDRFSINTVNQALKPTGKLIRTQYTICDDLLPLAAE